MGLPASQRRVLGTTEDALCGSDPHLAALFLLFSRLNQEEDMPRIELIRGRVAAVFSPLTCRLQVFGRWFGAPGRARLRTALFFPIALGLVACTVLLGSTFPDSSRCAHAPRASRTSRTVHASERARRTEILCPPVVANPVLGR
jgi:hypothetical protein